MTPEVAKHLHQAAIALNEAEEHARAAARFSGERHHHSFAMRVAALLRELQHITNTETTV